MINNNNPIKLTDYDGTTPLVYSSGSVLYKTHSPVISLNNFYWAQGSFLISGPGDVQATSTNNFGEDISKAFTRTFYWRGSIGISGEGQPKIKFIQFGDGYSQRYEDGINNQLMKFNISFEGRDDYEARGILHFLHEFGGTQSFFYTPPFPYNTQGRYICREFQPTFNFKNNTTINAKFEQVAE